MSGTVESADAIRVFLTGDESRSRRGLRALLATYPGIEVVAESPGGLDALILVDRLRPDVVVIDDRLRGIDGVETTRRIKQRWPQTAVMMLTMHPEVEQSARVAGVDAFVMKGCSAGDLVATLSRVARGK
jgi:DNA-binding NarL/FixJ family response regulator